MKLKLEKDIIIISYIALDSVGEIVENKYDELKKYFNIRYLDNLIIEAKKNNEMINSNAFIEKIKQIIEYDDLYLLNNISILNFLYEYAKKSNKGIRIYQKNIPIKQICIEICEFYSINPYRLASNFICIFCDNALRALENLKYNNIIAKHVGYVTDGRDKIIVDKEEIQYIDNIKQDEIYKIMEKI